MSITKITTNTLGEIGVKPRLVKLDTTDTFATITTAGYLSSSMSNGFTYYPSDMFEIVSSDQGTFLATITFNAGIPTLVSYATLSLGNVTAGKNGVAGAFISYPGTANTGYLELAATSNSGNYDVEITNATFGQATVLTIPDPGAATAFIPVLATTPVTKNLIVADGTGGLVKDGGARILSGVTAAYGGGSASHAYTVTGMTAGAGGAVTSVSQSNAEAILTAVTTANTLTVTWAGDPGANAVVSYIYTTAALT